MPNKDVVKESVEIYKRAKDREEREKESEGTVGKQHVSLRLRYFDQDNKWVVSSHLNEMYKWDTKFCSFERFDDYLQAHHYYKKLKEEYNLKEGTEKHVKSSLKKYS